tara:strand:+ start:606 stop:767 length:162 start_codon:yes stop_codon:yes gene_type:complete
MPATKKTSSKKDTKSNKDNTETIENYGKFIAYLLEENKLMKQKVDKIATRLGI